MEWAERESGKSPALQALKAKLLTFDSGREPRPVSKRRTNKKRSTR